MTSSLKNIKINCRHFRGDVPCKPSKQYNVECPNCKHFIEFDRNILIIKLGAAGDVIRTSPLLSRLKSEYPKSKIFWLTYSPELVPMYPDYAEGADIVLAFNLQSILYLQQIDFYIAVNLDKDKEAIGLMNTIKAEKKFGYTINNGICYPVNSLSEHKYLTGTFDSISKQNTKSYPEEIFEICGYKFNGERYILPVKNVGKRKWEIAKDKPVIGLNTGCGSRWTSRLWKDEYWIELTKLLLKRGFDVILLGGELEDKKNKMYSETGKAKYFGYFDLPVFIDEVNQCDVVVSQVTMGLHIAIGLGKKVVLLNNIFNKNEFELYNNGVIVEPSKECKCYFSPKCKNDDYECMEHLIPSEVFNAVEKLIASGK